MFKGRHTSVRDIDSVVVGRKDPARDAQFGKNGLVTQHFVCVGPATAAITSHRSKAAM